MSLRVCLIERVRSCWTEQASRAGVWIGGERASEARPNNFQRKIRVERHRRIKRANHAIVCEMDRHPQPNTF